MKMKVLRYALCMLSCAIGLSACAELRAEDYDDYEAGRIGEVEIELLNTGDGTGCRSERHCYATRNPLDNVPESCCYDVSICPCASTPDGSQECEYREPLVCEAYYRGPGSRLSSTTVTKGTLKLSP